MEKNVFQPAFVCMQLSKVGWNTQQPMAPGPPATWLKKMKWDQYFENIFQRDWKLQSLKTTALMVVGVLYMVTLLHGDDYPM